ncbi:MAG TPA: hemerythrin domain-containing protein [Burkholderiales bacterium]|nr:hemerythrin domain-containing protein [Burkholderiales bacterium]
MEFNRHISRRLHEEHEATLALWGRVEATRARDAGLLSQAAAALAHEVERHFVFEETELFPRLAAGGEGDIAALLAEEHATIRAAAKRFIALAREGRTDAEARALALELAERLFAHVQKEEMSLLPALEELVDEAADLELTGSYST